MTWNCVHRLKLISLMLDLKFTASLIFIFSTELYMFCFIRQTRSRFRPYVLTENAFALKWLWQSYHIGSLITSISDLTEKDSKRDCTSLFCIFWPFLINRIKLITFFLSNHNVDRFKNPSGKTAILFSSLTTFSVNINI